MEEEWTEQIFIDHVVKYINELIRDKKHRARVLAEKQSVVKSEIVILNDMLNWKDSKFEYDEVQKEEDMQND